MILLLRKQLLIIVLLTLFMGQAIKSYAIDYKKVDSAAASLDTTTQEPLKIEILQFLANQYLYISADSSMYFVDQSIKLAKANDFQKSLAISLRLKGVALYYMGEMSEALEYYGQSLEIRKALDDTTGQVLMLNNIALAHQRLGHLDTSKTLFLQSLYMAEKNHLLALQASACNNLGLYYQSKDELDSALFYYKQALTLNDSIQNLSEVALIRSNIASIYFFQGDYLSAISDFRLAFDLATQTDNDHVRYLSLMNIGAIYSRVGLHSQSVFVYKQVFDHYKAANHYANMVSSLSNLANAYYWNNELEMAINHFRELEQAIDSSQMKMNPDFSNQLYKAYTFQALAYHRLGDSVSAANFYDQVDTYEGYVDGFTRAISDNAYVEFLIGQNDIKRAKSILDENLKNPKLDSVPDVRSTSYELMSQIYEKMGQVNKAEELRKKSTKYLELHNTQEEKLSTMRSAIEFDSERRELALKVAEQENALSKSKITLLEEKKTRQWYIFLSTSGLLIGIAIWVFKSQRDKKRLLEKESERLKLSNENEMLKSQALSRELELKQKEILSQALQLAQKNEAINALKASLTKEFKANPSDSLKRSIQSLDSQISHEKDWASFRMSFESVYEHFFENLKTDYPDLSPRELQLCSLLRLNMSIKKMSSLLGISEEGVKKARYRIRKKVNLTDNPTSISAFLMKY